MSPITMFNMRNILFVIMASVLLACNSERKVLSARDNIESYIEREPKDALNELRRMKNEIVASKKAKAKYALLYSIALDKNYIDLTNDSIINPAIEYFSNKGSNDEKLLVHYYMGRIYQNAADLSNAAVSTTYLVSCSM